MQIINFEHHSILKIKTRYGMNLQTEKLEIIELLLESSEPRLVQEAKKICNLNFRMKVLTKRKMRN